MSEGQYQDLGSWAACGILALLEDMGSFDGAAKNGMTALAGSRRSIWGVRSWRNIWPRCLRSQKVLLELFVRSVNPYILSSNPAQVHTLVALRNSILDPTWHSPRKYSPSGFCAASRNSEIF